MSSILFSQYWDVKNGMFDQYTTFISNYYNPTLDRLGVRLVGGYYVAAGQGPQIVAVAALEDKARLVTALASRDYREISNRLLGMVENYSSRVWAPTGHIHTGPYRIQTGVWKFNQYYDILPGQEEEHYRFVKEQCLPSMEKLGVPITGGWRLVVGGGPRTLAECTASNIKNIAQAVDSSEFRRLVRTLKNDLATNYSSRILAPTGRVEVPYLMSEMLKGF